MQIANWARMIAIEKIKTVLTNSMPAISLITGDATLDLAFRIALGDIYGNIVPFQDGLLDQPENVLLAGMDYVTPWTRDTAINTWNGAGLLFPQVMHNTLLSVLQRDGDTICIGGQYWDAIIWAIGAEAYHAYTGDQAFLQLAFNAVRNTLTYLEQEEFDTEQNLFRGAACYGDGVAAYPDLYARTNNASGILAWPGVNPDLATHPGYGLPMHALSTNCLYYAAYCALDRMARELNMPDEAGWLKKAEVLKRAINTHFWMMETGTYRYLVDPFGGSERQEGLGHAFALLFGVANEAQARSVLQHQHITAQGIPCVWPPFERYTRFGQEHFGRHCGVIWPHIQGFWAHASAQYGRIDLFTNELYSMASKARRDGQFAEIYHPITGQIYGGLQEGYQELGYGNEEWRSCSRQSWSATAYVRAILMGLFGMSFEPSGISFTPTMPSSITLARLQNLPYRDMLVDIEVSGSGNSICSCTLNGQILEQPVLPDDGKGQQHIVLHMKNE